METRHRTSRTLGLFADVSRLAAAGLPGRGRRLAAILLVRRLGPFHYPIQSRVDLGEQIQMERIRFMGLTINIKRALTRVSAHYFPIASFENFVEKVADLLKGSRLPRSVRMELRTMAGQLPELQYPIPDVIALTRQIASGGAIQFRGRKFDLRNSNMPFNSIPQEFFPVRSRNDFAFKVAALAGARALRTSA